MKDLFFMECRKIIRSIPYWLYVAVLTITSIRNYDAAVEHELHRTNDPASVFYTAENGIYADTVDEFDKGAQNAMMLGATGRLLDNYRNNRYEYYPFGYVKEKKLSKKQQGIILLYLEELTGLSETAIVGMGEGNDPEKLAGFLESPVPKNEGGDNLKEITGSSKTPAMENREGNDSQEISGSPKTPATENREGNDSQGITGSPKTPAIENRENNDSQEISGSPKTPAIENRESNDSQGITDSPKTPAVENEGNNPIEDIDISGGGAFILSPGKGGAYENGQFVAEPDDWEYVENPSVDGLKKPTNFPEPSAAKTDKNNDTKEITDAPKTAITETEENNHLEDTKISITPKPSNNKLEIQVSFDRFKEIMEDVSDRIGRNSYFSWTMLTMYYCGNDMQDAPITEKQHREFYENDRVTGAFARYFCDSISLIILCLPAFLIIDLLLKDKRCKISALIQPRTAGSANIILPRFLAAAAMAMLPILLLPLRSLATLTLYCHSIGVRANIFAFVLYIVAWVFPTVLLVISIALFVTVLTENYSAVFLTGLIWLFGRPTLDKMAGGNYGIFDLVIRHNTLKGYGRMMENIDMLVFNRLLATAAALLLTGLAVAVYDAKRKGGIVFGNQKFFDTHHHKHSNEF